MAKKTSSSPSEWVDPLSDPAVFVRETARCIGEDVAALRTALKVTDAELRAATSEEDVDVSAMSFSAEAAKRFLVVERLVLAQKCADEAEQTYRDFGEEFAMHTLLAGYRYVAEIAGAGLGISLGSRRQAHDALQDKRHALDRQIRDEVIAAYRAGRWRSKADAARKIYKEVVERHNERRREQLAHIVVYRWILAEKNT